jgi:hypothetical protein
LKLFFYLCPFKDDVWNRISGRFNRDKSISVSAQWIQSRIAGLKVVVRENVALVEICGRAEEGVVVEPAVAVEAVKRKPVGSATWEPGNALTTFSLGLMNLSYQPRACIKNLLLRNLQISVIS